MKKLLLLLIFILQIGFLFGQKDFSFVFLPDAHLRPDSAVEATFDRVTKQINELNPNFVIAGGDMIYTAKNVNEKKAKVLFDLMDTKFRKLKMPVYYTMGNHEIVGVLAESGMAISHPLWGKAMYRERYGETYKTFIYSGWKFFLLDGILINEKSRGYSEAVDSLQQEWIKQELALTDTLMPLCIAIHTPLINPKPLADAVSIYPLRSKNSKEVLALFDRYNLKLVLQGHNHVYMNLLINGKQYISGGSTSNSRPIDNFDDGFVKVKVTDDEIKTEFVHTDRKNVK